MGGWGFKKMGEMWLTDPRVRMIVRDKDSPLAKAIVESEGAVERGLDMDHAPRARQHFWDGVPQQETRSMA
jgi:hypothetical protein